MSRVIKFRAWTGSDMIFDVVVGGLGAFYAAGLDPKDKACITPFNTIYSKETPIMQFTGLLDKKGVEVFDGDIVEDLAGNILEIWWDNEYATWRNIYRKGNIVSCRDGHFPLWQSYFARGSAKSECIIAVIGNIYQHPHLLEGGKNG